MKNIGILGCGNMGSAIARGIAATLPELSLHLYDSDSEKLHSVSGELSAVEAASIEAVVMESDITIIAIKPQVFSLLYQSVTSMKHTNSAFISIAAGISLESLTLGLDSSQVVRFMPNIAASVGKAVTAVCHTAECSQTIIDDAFTLAGTIGTAFPLAEEHFPAFVGISGSAIAFFYQFLHAIALGGTREGIPYAQSLDIAADTFAGAIELMHAKKADPATLIHAVCSPAGTTIEGLYKLEKGNLQGTAMDAVHAAAVKARNIH